MYDVLSMARMTERLPDDIHIAKLQFGVIFWGLVGFISKYAYRIETLLMEPYQT